MRSRARWLLSFLGWLIVLAAALEVLLQLGIATPRHQHFGSDLGNYAEPGRRVVHSAEGYSVSHTSSIGLFDDEVRSVRPRLRALLLGDSFSEALQVAPDERFAALTERLVPGLEIINTGLSGRGPAHYLLVLQHLDPSWDPDVVVMQLNDGDLDDVTSRRQPHLEPTPGGGHRVVLGDRGALHRLIQRLSRPVTTRLALPNLMLERAVLLNDLQVSRLRDKLTGTPAAPAASATIATARASAIQAAIAEAARHSRRLILLYLPKIEYSSAACAIARPEVRELYRRAAASAGATFLDPSDEICRETALTGQPAHGFHNGVIGTGHLNARGHMIVARVLARELGKAP